MDIIPVLVHGKGGHHSRVLRNCVSLGSSLWFAGMVDTAKELDASGNVRGIINGHMRLM